MIIVIAGTIQVDPAIIIFILIIYKEYKKKRISHEALYNRKIQRQ